MNDMRASSNWLKAILSRLYNANPCPTTHWTTVCPAADPPCFPLVMIPGSGAWWSKSGDELHSSKSLEGLSLELSNEPLSSGSDQGPPYIFLLCHSSAGGWSSNSRSSKPAASAPLGRGIFC
nr:hypothetical protein Iba_chr06dCG4370 [Ipomoea batatas]